MRRLEVLKGKHARIMLLQTNFQQTVWLLSAVITFYTNTGARKRVFALLTLNVVAIHTRARILDCSFVVVFFLVRNCFLCSFFFVIRLLGALVHYLSNASNISRCVRVFSEKVVWLRRQVRKVSFKMCQIK